MSNDRHGNVLDHSYDGIQEYDNPQPGWWSWIFILSIVFSIVYFIFFHMGGPGLSVEEQYEQSVAAQKAKEAEIAKTMKLEVTEEAIFAMTTNPAELAPAKEHFATKCLACHMADGGGLIGPNFTDDYYINGGRLMDLYNTISEGVPAKGMVPWKGTLSEKERMQLAAYIRTLRGTTPAKAKEPQGDLWVIDGIKAEKAGGSAPAADAAPQAPDAAAPAAEAPATPEVKTES